MKPEVASGAPNLYLQQANRRVQQAYTLATTAVQSRACTAAAASAAAWTWTWRQPSWAGVGWDASIARQHYPVYYACIQHARAVAW